MAFYQPPTQNLGIFDPDVFDQNDEPLTIETGSKYFLRFPMAQAGETLQAINVLGNTRLYKPLIMASTEQTEREIQTSYVTYLDTGNVAGRYSEIVQNGFNFNLTNRVNQGAINLNVDSAGGVQATPIIVNFVNTIIANNLQANSTSEFKRPMIMNDTTDINNRRITSTFFDFYDAGVLATLNTIGTIYNQSGAMYIQNTFNGGSISLVCDEAGGTQQSPLQVTAGSVLVNKALQIAANTNITMPNGTGSIQQQRVSGDVSSANILKKTIIAFNSGTNAGSGNTTLDILDNFNNKGLYILCNSGSGSLSPTNREGDVVIGSRNEDNGCITISNYNNNYQNGMRVFTTKSTGVDNCATILYNGQSNSNDWAEFRMAYDRITLKQTTSFNHPINFNPTTPYPTTSARRRLEGLGTLSFTDISGNDTTTGTITSSIWTDSSLVNSLNGMYYDCGINGGFHQFSVKDSGGNISTPIYYGTNLTSVSNTLVIRNSTTTSNRLDFTTDSSTPNTTIRTRSIVAGSNASITFSCDTVTALGVVITLPNCVLAPFTFEMRRAVQLNYITTPFNNTQLGFLTSATITTTAFSTQTSPNNLGSLALGVGTWEITLLISFQASGNHSYSTFSYGINSVTAAFPTAMPYLVSYMREPNLTINAVTITKQISMTLQLTVATTIYFVEQVVFAGGGTTTIGANYTYTRIG
jgi:hypothetical protein